MSAEDRKTRGSYRTSVTRLVQKIENELSQRPADRDLHKLKHYRDTLPIKKDLLQQMDQLIWKQISEDEADEEMEQVDLYLEKIAISAMSVEEAIQTAEAELLTDSPPIRHRPTPALRSTAGTRSGDGARFHARSAEDPESTDGSTSHTPLERIHTPPTRMPASVSSLHPLPADSTPKIKLPKLTIRKFNGEITAWTPFWNQFQSAIHNNPSLNDIDKFNYLLSYLEGEAAEEVEGMALTAANYPEAIGRLEERFGDTSYIVGQHIQELMDLSPVRNPQDLTAIRKLLSKVKTHMASLRALGEPEETYGRIVTSVLMKSLPTDIKLNATKELGAHTPHVSRLLTLLNQEVTARERLARMEGEQERNFTPPTRPQPTSTAFLVNTKGLCIFCGKEHAPETCRKVPQPSARSNILRKQGRCFNCLRRNHLSRECRGKERCNKCNGKHHVAVCRQEERSSPRQQGGGAHHHREGSATPGREEATPTNSLLAGSDSPILQQTAMVTLSNPEGSQNRTRRVRALLDTGSQRSYISLEAAKALQLTSRGTETLRIQTFGTDTDSEKTCHRVQFDITTKNRSILTMEALATSIVCQPFNNQATLEAVEKHPHLKKLHLADPSRAEDEIRVDLLVGLDYYWSLVTGNIRKCKQGDGPTAVQTRLGWVLSGPTDLPGRDTSTTTLVNTTRVMRVHTTTLEDKLDNQLQKFWDLETLGIQQQEASVQESFSQTIEFKEGRYQVQLPWKPTHRALPTNLQLCKKRLKSLVKKLQSTPEVLMKYDEVIQDQISRGIVEAVPEEDINKADKIHYLPHHGVVRNDKATTKLRVVYDGSAKTGASPSLNDCLYTGPNLEQSIFSILIKFRVHPVAMAADVEKAFLMVSVHPQDRDALRFLWVNNTQDENPEPIHLRFTRVTFGVNASPFLLKATIEHHIRTYQEEDPTFVATFLNSIYVDDVSYGAENNHQAYQLFTKSKRRLAEAGFHLRKFLTNSTSLQTQVDSNEEETTPSSTPEEDQSFAKASLGVKGEESGRREAESKILGVRWRYKEDNFVFGVEEMRSHLRKERPTKRDVVGAGARIFDPLGVLTPVTVLWKVLFQAICKEGGGWDDPLRGESLKEWERLSVATEEAVQLTIPRCFNTKDSTERRLIGFCDASTRAYAAVVYLRIGGEGEARTEFVAARTRVAPTQPTTIPRLELLSALLLSKLCTSVETALRNTLELGETICYTDSKVALYWIQGMDGEWKQFVNNRVNSIRQLQPAGRWRHCPGKSNPADIPSRGMLPRELQQEERWLHGPDWLVKDSNPPRSGETQGIPEECLAERKRPKTRVLLTASGEKRGLGSLLDASRFSSLKRILGVTAQVLRFVDLIRGRSLTQLRAKEKARILWLKEVQKELTSDDKFETWRKQLDLVVGEDGLWRCQGRLKNSSLLEGAQHPILIGRSHHVSHLIVAESHHRVMHGGLKATLTDLRGQYWMLKGRQAIRKIIGRCPTCRRYEGPAFHGLKAPDLPSFRSNISRPFTAVGIDFAGPLHVKGQDQPKTWVCLLTCSATRAVHLELVQDLSMETFLRCLRRFCARRGTPDRIISDNAQTFRAADRALQELLTNPEVSRRAELLGINWKFITERAPWQGGFYERLVESMKRCLRKSIGQNSLTLDELQTVLAEVEAVLNSRPISYVSSDDLEEPLTPSHLLTGHRLLSLPDHPAEEEDPDFEITPSTITRRMRHLSTVKTKLWDRWRDEYLHELREHHRQLRTTKGVHRPVQEGEVVVIYEDTLPRGMWRLGKVEKLISGNDGNVRAAQLKVHSKEGRTRLVNRPIQHLHPIEVREEEAVPPDSSEKELTPRPTGPPPSEETSSGPGQRRPQRAAAAKARVRFKELSSQDLI